MSNANATSTPASSSTAPVPVLAVVRGADGVWEAIVDVVHTGADVDVRDDLNDDDDELAVVRVLGDERTLRVFVDDDDGRQGVVRYTDALPE